MRKIEENKQNREFPSYDRLKESCKGIGGMRRFRYSLSQVLRMIMAATGGILILALAGTYEKGQKVQEEGWALKEFERDFFQEGLAAIFRLGYPGAADEAYGADSGEDSWEKRLLLWIGGRNPRMRWKEGQEADDGFSSDPDPSFAPYLESRRVVAESSYLLFGGGEETGLEKADLAGVWESGQDLGEGGEAGREKEPAAGQVQSLPAGTAARHLSGDLPVTGTSYVMEQLADYDFLMKHFFSVHSSTTAGRDEMNAAKLLGEDLSLEKDGDNPQILIYHTHSQETFADYGPDRPDATVVGIGDYLTELLEAKGYRVIHNKEVYDLVDGELDRSKAYDYALSGITGFLQQYPSIQVVLDIHRDGVRENLHMVSEINGKPTAPIMFFNGMSQTPEGPIEYLPNPYKEQNLAFSLQMQLDAAAYFPGLTRKIYLKGFRYNLHLRPRSALIEVGAQTNTYEEARNAMEPLAELLDMVLCPKEAGES